MLAPETPSYRVLFQRYINAGLRQSLHRIQNLAPRLPEPDRIQAWHVLSYGLSIDSAWSDAKDLLLSLSPLMEQAGFRDEWMAYLLAGIEQARSQKDRASEGQLAIQLGLLHQLTSRFDQASEWLQQAVACFSDSADYHHLGIAYNLLANVAIQGGKADAAKNYVQKALATFTTNDPELAYTAYVQGDIALFEQKYEEAESHFRRGLALRRQQGDSRRIALALRNLALALQHLRRYEESIACNQEAIDRFEALGDIRNLATARMNLSIVYYDCGQFATALALLAQAEPDYHRTGDEQALAQLYTNRAIYQRHAGLLVDAEASSRDAIACWERLGSVGNTINALDGLGLALLAQTRYSEAIQTFKRGIDLLPQIKQHPRYRYYQRELHDHLLEAQRLMTH
jgi:tetratricopeptide (TPR) repeat protein